MTVALLIAASAAGAAASVHAADDVSLSIAIYPPEVTAGGTAKVHVIVSWPGAQDAYSIEKLEGPDRAGASLTTVADDFATTQEAGKPRFRRQVTYLVRAEEPGTISLSPARVTVKAAGGATREYNTEALGVIVRPGRGPVPAEAWFGLLAVGLIVVGARIARRPAPPPPPKSRADVAAERVEALRGVGHRDHRQFFGACVDALREGLAQIAPAVARDRDRAKIVQALREAGVPGDRISAAEELVALCDEARFNPEPPGNEARERALNLLRTALS